MKSTFVLLLLPLLLHSTASLQPFEANAMKQLCIYFQFPAWPNECDQKFCQWEGVHCAANETNLIGIDWEYRNLIGTIPEVLFDLRHLQKLVLRGNLLTGTLSKNFTRLEMLSGMDLSHNKFEGFVPPLSQMNFLDFIDISYTDIGGTLPTDYSTLTNLAQFLVSHTAIRGSFPPHYAKLSNLIRLDISATNLNGTLHSDFSLLSKLTSFHFNQTNISGVLPHFPNAIPSCFGSPSTCYYNSYPYTCVGPTVCSSPSPSLGVDPATAVTSSLFSSPPPPPSSSSYSSSPPPLSSPPSGSGSDDAAPIPAISPSSSSIFSSPSSLASPDSPTSPSSQTSVASPDSPTSLASPVSSASSAAASSPASSSSPSLSSSPPSLSSSSPHCSGSPPFPNSTCVDGIWVSSNISIVLESETIVIIGPTSLNGSLNLSSSSLTLDTVLELTGNLSLEGGSSLILNQPGASLVVTGGLTFSPSSSFEVLHPSSRLNVSGCVHYSGQATIKVDSSESSQVVMTHTCQSGVFSSIEVESDEDCRNVHFKEAQYSQSSLMILYDMEDYCIAGKNAFSWIALLGATSLLFLLP